MYKITPGLFRLLLAFVVVIHHSVDFLLIGHAAVYIFFILSGYWIAKMYSEKYIKYQDTYKVFMLSRLMRLLPVYYLILLISIVVAVFYRNILESTQLSNPLFYLANLFIIGQNNTDYLLIATGWSLDIELQFYFLAPILLIALMKLKTISVVLCTILLAFLYLFINNNDYFFVISYLPFFVIGMSIYTKEILFSDKTSLLCTVILFVFYVSHYIIPDLRDVFLNQKNFILAGFSYRELVNLILSILIIPFVTINVRSDASGQKEKIFASMSYVIYLLHYPLIIVYSTYVGGLSMFEKIPYLGVYLFSCVFFSYMISRYYDQYFEKKRSAYLKALPENK